MTASQRSIPAIEQALHCLVCNEAYTVDGAHVPRILARCGHTICESCCNNVLRSNRRFDGVEVFVENVLIRREYTSLDLASFGHLQGTGSNAIPRSDFHLLLTPPPTVSTLPTDGFGATIGHLAHYYQPFPHSQA